jgi:DNA-binding NtrC family response regulator
VLLQRLLERNGRTIPCPPIPASPTLSTNDLKLLDISPYLSYTTELAARMVLCRLGRHGKLCSAAAGLEAEVTSIADNQNSSARAGAAITPGDLLIWQPSVLMAVAENIEVLGKRDCPVIIRGETGTAKESLARQIHSHSRRSAEPFIPVNCSALRGRIAHSQLFGQVKAAVGTPETISLGAFRSADRGTIFLDEIDKLSIDTQAKVIMVLQHRSVQPVGSGEYFAINVRVICATGQDLRQTTQDGRFMPELYFLLNVATIDLPPLRQRPDDIVILAKYFLDLHAQMYNEPAKELEPPAISALTRYGWPGNVRELASVMERAFVMSRSNKIGVEDLPAEIVTADVVPESKVRHDFPGLDDVDRKLVIRALETARGQKMVAAKLLRIDHRKLNRLIKKFDLEPGAFKDD